MLNLFNVFMLEEFPLELSYNPCNNGCLYCYTNLNYQAHSAKCKPAGKIFTNFVNKINKVHLNNKVDNLTDYFFKDGYGIILSNKSDPLTDENINYSIETAKILKHFTNPLRIQTKGNLKNFKKLLPHLKADTVFYITITSDNPKILNHFEPCAPELEDRIACIKEAQSRGFHVQVGINPYVPEWWEGPEHTIKFIEQIGPDSIFLENLHFNQKQKNELQGLPVFSEERLQKASKKDSTKPDSKEASIITRWCANNHIAVFGYYPKFVNPANIEYFEKKRDYPTAPTWEEFITWVMKEALKQGMEGGYYVNDFYKDYAESQHHFNNHQFKKSDWLKLIDLKNQIPRETKKALPPYMTFSEVFRMIVSEIGCDNGINGLTGYNNIAYLMKDEDEGENDKYGNPVLLYIPDQEIREYMYISVG